MDAVNIPKCQPCKEIFRDERTEKAPSASKPKKAGRNMAERTKQSQRRTLRTLTWKPLCPMQRKKGLYVASISHRVSGPTRVTLVLSLPPRGPGIFDLNECFELPILEKWYLPRIVFDVVNGLFSDNEHSSHSFSSLGSPLRHVCVN